MDCEPTTLPSDSARIPLSWRNCGQPCSETQPAHRASRCYGVVGRKRVTCIQMSSETDWMDCEPSTVAQRFGSDSAILA